VRYLPESLIADVPRIVAGLRVGQSFSTIPVPNPPVIRRGASGSFYDKGLEGASHHAVIPNVNTIDKLQDVWPRLSSDEKKLFDVIARAYLAALMPDFRYRQTTATLDVRGFEFRASGRQPIDLGWRVAFPEWQPADEKSDEAQLLPPLRNGETAQLHDPKIEDKETRPPSLAAVAFTQVFWQSESSWDRMISIEARRPIETPCQERFSRRGWRGVLRGLVR
jgi:DNA topoisomerase-3